MKKPKGVVKNLVERAERNDVSGLYASFGHCTTLVPIMPIKVTRLILTNGEGVAFYIPGEGIETCWYANRDGKIPFTTDECGYIFDNCWYAHAYSCVMEHAKQTSSDEVSVA